MNWLARLLCLFQGHIQVRRALDPTMRQSTLTVIVCLACGKEFPDTHLQ